jgi:predicted ATPase
MSQSRTASEETAIARAVQPRFALDRANARILGEICRRLDGLPLALELAAARVKVLPPQAILGRLSHRRVAVSRGPVPAVSPAVR